MDPYELEDQYQQSRINSLVLGVYLCIGLAGALVTAAGAIAWFTLF